MQPFCPYPIPAALCVHAGRRAPAWSFWHVLIAHHRDIRYLMKVLPAPAGTRRSLLASLRELCVTDGTKRSPPIKIALESEPTFGAPCAAFMSAASKSPLPSLAPSR